MPKQMVTVLWVTKQSRCPSRALASMGLTGGSGWYSAGWWENCSQNWFQHWSWWTRTLWVCSVGISWPWSKGRDGMSACLFSAHQRPPDSWWAWPFKWLILPQYRHLFFCRWRCRSAEESWVWPSWKLGDWHKSLLPPPLTEMAFDADRKGRASRSEGLFIFNDMKCIKSIVLSTYFGSDISDLYSSSGVISHPSPSLILVEKALSCLPSQSCVIKRSVHLRAGWGLPLSFCGGPVPVTACRIAQMGRRRAGT